MPGFLNFRRNSIAVLLALALLAALITGCGSENETTRPSPAESGAAGFLLKYEKTFNPSEFNPDPHVIKGRENSLFESLHASTMVIAVLPETIPGFRVQAFLSQDYDEAGIVHDSLSSAFPDELIYTVYDLPFYKVRIGNFTERQKAGVLLRKIISMGYKDAWIVPDKVLKNPPPRLPDRIIEPGNPLEHDP
jgi:hypothetical protein